MADTVHAGLTEMRGTTAPRLLLELVCARMLLPATDGSAAATLQRLERLERRMSIAGETAGRPAAEAPVRDAAPREAPARPTPAPSPPPAPVAAPAAERDAAPRTEYVRPSQRAEATPPARPASPPAAAAASADDWPETVQPGSRGGRSGSAAAASSAAPSAAPKPPKVAQGEPDIPLPPEPTDDEDWPSPASPGATRAAAARTEAAESGNTAAAPPRAAAESSPVPRGGEPTPVVSANPEPAADGELTTSDVRRVWPELLAVVKRHKRTTEALLKSAQVQGLANGVLTLAATSPALAKMLGDDLNRDVIRQALLELLGVRWKVTVVVEGAAATSGPPVAPEQAREAARAAETAEANELMAERAAEAGGDREPEPVVDQEQAALSLLRAQLGARPLDG
jgi:DNA polymerase-3 subunit gamma/tau